MLGGGVLRTPTSGPVTTTAGVDEPFAALLEFIKEMQALPSH